MKTPKSVLKILESTNKISSMSNQNVEAFIERQNRMMESIIPLNKAIQRHNEMMKRFASDMSKIEFPKFENYINADLLEAFKKISEIPNVITNHPEYQFAFITDLEILNYKTEDELKESLVSNLTDEDINKVESVLTNNLLPYLEKLNLDTLWLGAEMALNEKSNPDKIRHCLISLRTILEYLIDVRLAPNNKLLKEKMFQKDFKNFKKGKTNINKVKIYKSKKIEYIVSRIDFGVLEEFTKKDVNYICNCYSILCNVHQPQVGINEKQMRGLKVKTGIIIWLLVYIDNILDN